MVFPELKAQRAVRLTIAFRVAGLLQRSKFIQSIGGAWAGRVASYRTKYRHICGVRARTPTSLPRSTIGPRVPSDPGLEDVAFQPKHVLEVPNPDQEALPELRSQAPNVHPMPSRPLAGIAPHNPAWPPGPRARRFSLAVPPSRHGRQFLLVPGTWLEDDLLPNGAFRCST